MRKSWVKFVGPDAQPFPNVLADFRVKRGQIYDLREVADLFKRNGTPASAAPEPSGNGKAHLPNLDYSPEAFRAKAEGLRAQAQLLIQQAETLEEAARLKDIFAQAKAIMES